MATRARPCGSGAGYPIDFILERLFEIGLEPEDVRHLERLSDDRVLEHVGTRELRYTRREDVVVYMRAWADLLERALPVRLTPAAPLADAAERASRAAHRCSRVGHARVLGVAVEDARLSVEAPRASAARA